MRERRRRKKLWFLFFKQNKILQRQQYQVTTSLELMEKNEENQLKSRPYKFKIITFFNPVRVCYRKEKLNYYNYYHHY